jgi:hypothetical protein
MNLENLNLVELNAQEVQVVEGGYASSIEDDLRNGCIPSRFPKILNL